MKRSKSVNLSRMRKRAVALSALAVLGCEEEEAVVVSSVEDCVAKTEYNTEQCQKAYDQAMAESQNSAPKYSSSSDCEAEFGPEGCYDYNDQYMPRLDGFLIAMDILANSFYPTPVYLYGGVGEYRGHYMTGRGDSIGRPGQTSYQVSRTVASPGPRTTTSTSRGGFARVATSQAATVRSSGSSFGG